MNYFNLKLISHIWFYVRNKQGFLPYQQHETALLGFKRLYIESLLAFLESTKQILYAVFHQFLILLPAQPHSLLLCQTLDS